MEKEKLAEIVRPPPIPEPEWKVYQRAISAVKRSNVPFLFGGAFALGVYTGKWRDTKDLDLIVSPNHRDVLARALTDAGFEDYFDKLPYDRGWIYRATREGYIVDVIWSMANRRADVDEEWFANAVPIDVHDQLFHVVPAEELLWHKLYVMQRERCDWPDVLNLLYGTVSGLDWDRLFHRLGNDLGLLDGALKVFAWLCPGRVADIPIEVRERFHLAVPDGNPPLVEPQRVNWLDARPWFGPLEPAEAQPLDI